MCHTCIRWDSSPNSFLDLEGSTNTIRNWAEPVSASGDLQPYEASFHLFVNAADLISECTGIYSTGTMTIDAIHAVSRSTQDANRSKDFSSVP